VSGVRGLAPPLPATWQSRSDWFWRAHDINAGPAPLDLDAQATLLLDELEVVYCAGAWTAVVILAWTLVEAALRRAGDDAKPTADVDWLRAQRNGLVHVGSAGEIPDEAGMEALAQGALRVAFKTLYAVAWTSGPAR
jgi:hypothetical protein